MRGPSTKLTYVFKVAWPSTVKWITVEARNETDAYDKATKRKDVKGCSHIELMEER